MSNRKPQDTIEPWRTLGTTEVFRNRWTGVYIDDVELPDGRRYEYTRLRPAGIGVAIIGFDSTGRMLLEREYRHGVGEIIWQLPGGLANAEESLQAAGLRELREETGFAPATVNERTVRYLGCVWDNPALGTGVSHIFAAWDLEQIGEAVREAAEVVELHWQWPYWVKEAIRAGEIRDRVVIAAVAHLMLEGRI